ncbi:MAG TPA: PRC-barrel domain-containing protein [Gemmatimonadaceae bacterium]|nr:PRC-barrel domain-containing protein [Gemmatimonadaceae bacterium]
MSQDDREARDAAGVGPYARELDELVPMNTLRSWKVTDGDPDIRGWEVQTVSNRRIGTVLDLLIDASAGEVVMLDVDLAGTDRHALVPIRIVQIDRPRRVVLMDSADMPETDAAGAQTETGATHDPRTDREVVIGRTTVADSMLSREGEVAPEVSDEAIEIERRRNERRQIHRVSTDI